MQFFYRLAGKILEAHIGQFLQFDPVGAPTKIVKITQKLVSNVNEFIYGNLRNENAETTYDSLERQICHCRNVKFLDPKIKTLLSDNKLLHSVQEFQTDMGYEIYQINNDAKKYIKKQGAYFDYFNTVRDIDLSRY